MIPFEKRKKIHFLVTTQLLFKDTHYLKSVMNVLVHMLRCVLSWWFAALPLGCGYTGRLLSLLDGPVPPGAAPATQHL